MANFELGNLVWKITGETSGFDKNIKKADKTAKGFGSTLKKAFSVAVIALAVKKIVSVGAALVGIASDAEETKNKFDVVFKDVSTGANKAFNDLANNYGIARTEARGLLADNADMLQGFGLASEASLDLATQAAQLGADLASFTNAAGGAAQVTADLGKLMLGERESVKKYGIAITETGLKEFAEEQGLAYAEMTKGEKATLSLQLAILQSKNAIGDFQRSMGSFANQSKIASARLTDVKTVLGESILPIANVGVTAFNKLSTSLIAAAQGIKDFVTSTEGSEKIGKVMGDIAGSFGVAWEIGKELFQGLSGFLKTILQPFADMQTETGKSGVAIALLSGVVNTLSAGMRILALFVKGAITTIVDIGRVVKKVGTLFGDFIDILLFKKGAKEQFNATMAELGNSIEALGTNAVQNVKDIVGGVVEEITGFGDNTQELANKMQSQFDAVSNKVSNTVTVALQQAGDQQEKNNQATEDGVEAVVKLSEAETKAAQEQFELRKSLAENVRANRIKTEEAAEQIHERELERIEEEKQAERDKWSDRFSLAKNFFSQITKIAGIFQDGEDVRIDNREKRELEALENLSLTEEELNKRRKERIQNLSFEEKKSRDRKLKELESLSEVERQKELERMKAVEDLQTLKEEKEERQNSIEKKFADERARQKTKEAKADKAAAIFDIAISTSIAAVQALPNLILAGIVTALGVAQGAAVAAKPIPKFAQGGIVPQMPGVPKTGDKQLAAVNPGELLLNEAQQSNLASKMGITINQYNTVNTDTQANLEKAARILYSPLAAEGARRG